MEKVKFLDLKKINQRHRFEIDLAIKEVLDSGCYLFGEKTKEFEFSFANFCGVILLALIYNLIIPQFVNLAGKFEIFFVNELSLPFNSGTIFFFLLIITSIVLGLIKTKKYTKKSISFKRKI